VLEEAEYGTILHAIVVALDGSSAVRGGMPVDHADPAAAGVELARQLRAAGGDQILGALR